MTNTYLSTKQVSEETGWSVQKIRGLIHSGRLPAIDTSRGSRATFEIRRCDLEALLTPVNLRPAKIRRTTSRQRVDAGVPKVFG